MDRSVPRKACRRLLLGLAPLTLGVLLIAGAAVAPPASAATEPVNTQPSAGSVLDSAPSRVRLTFAQSIMPGSLIEVHGPRGLADNGAERISNRTIIQPLASDLPAGMYTVAWQVVLRDGEQSFSRYTFTVQAEHTQDPRPTRKTPTTPPQKTPTTPEHRESSSPASAAPSPRGTVPTADTSADAAADAAALPAANSAFGGGKSTGDIVLGVFSLVAAAALIVGLAYGWHAGWWQNGLPLTGGAPGSGPGPGRPSPNTAFAVSPGTADGGGPSGTADVRSPAPETAPMSAPLGPPPGSGAEPQTVGATPAPSYRRRRH